MADDTESIQKVITNSVQPDHEFFDQNWPDNFSIPRSLSTGGWTVQSPGYEQQTFLGASITSFTMNGGYGDTSSTLSVDLVVDEFNKSDGSGLGFGDDVYHSGIRDQFRPPFVGSPVFFKFGKYRSSVSAAFYNAIEELIFDVSGVCREDKKQVSPMALNDLKFLPSGFLYDIEEEVLVAEPSNKSCALTFGGILQSYTQNRGTNGNPLYSVQVTDPREILSNVRLILNNYTGSIHDNDNIFNIYGFLEYNPPSSWNRKTLSFSNNEVKRKVNKDGTVNFTGDDTYKTFNTPNISGSGIAPRFPITGRGYARRSAQGIPFYRVNQALAAMMSYGGELPKEYKEAKFANSINFRGFKYVVDLTSLPALPDFYYLDFDEMSLLELALEVCDVMNRDLFVSLLPVIDHPYCKFLHDKNLRHMAKPSGQEDFIAGIIRCDAIDRSKQQDIGSIKSYLDDLEKQNIYVENRDVGFEVSNIVTDKFIAGAQETDMYFFSTMEDRKNDPVKPAAQYDLENMLSQQVIPYYGTLGNNLVTIPKGYGSYQQILLDTRGLNANGVGAYYVATEMELRCAMISYKRWKDFLMEYNDKYMESTEENDILETAILSTSPNTDIELPSGLDNLPIISNNYAVTVPRSLWPCVSFKDTPLEQYDDDGFPKSPCNPPYGYPLYYQRATKLGIPEAGLTQITYTWNSQILPALTRLKNVNPNSENFKTTINTVLDSIDELFGIKDVDTNETPSLLSGIRDWIVDTINVSGIVDLGFDILMDKVTNIQKTMSTLPRLSRKGTENAQRVHSFLKDIGSECLGKKFLVKLPKKVNFTYDRDLKIKPAQYVTNPPVLNSTIEKGPYGFKPLPKGSGMAIISEEFDNLFQSGVIAKSVGHTLSNCLEYTNTKDISDDEVYDNYRGAFEFNYNPFSNLIETNYKPEPQGGFYKRDIYKDIYDEETGVNLSLLAASGKIPLGVKQKLIPNIISKFTSDNGRINAYVRFDHSEYLSFDGISQNDLIQNTIENGKFVPDLAYNLDNLNDTNTDFTRFYNKNDNENDNKTDKPLKQQVAFLKCSVEDKIYFSPPIETRTVKVYGRTVKDERLVTLPKQVLDPDTDKLVYTHGYQLKNYKPDPSGDGQITSRIKDFVRKVEKNAKDEIVFSGIVEDKLHGVTSGILASLEGPLLGRCEAYALITLPGRITPTKDARFRDGPYQLMQPETIKHFLTMDVVKDVTGFEIPAFISGIPDILDIENEEKCITSKYQNAKELYKTALDKMQYALPQRVDLALPSPVIPNLVVLPLTSTERFYGPWISSEVDNRNDDQKLLGTAALPRYKDLGGAIEFTKDENLAPWNYFGYSKLNEAGKLRSTFANSLLLLSERGGFVVPDTPSGLTLGRELKNGGPLVTNISVDISTQGIKTTTQLDLYTVSFGKLQKQKEAELSRSSRERKKLSDERNSLIRKGLGKSQSDVNYGKLQKEFNDQLKMFESLIDKATNAKLIPATELVATVKSETMDRFIPGPTGGVQSKVEAKRTGIDTAMQTKDALGEAGEKFPTLVAANKSYYNSAGGDLGKIYTPASMEPYHQNMPSKHDSFIENKDSLYFESDGDFNNDGQLDITVYED